MLKISLLVSLFLSLLSPLANSQTVSSESNEKSPRFAIHLLDYLAHDYAGAIGAGGKVISENEFSEQKEFVHKIYELSENLPEIKNDQITFQKIIKLKTMIGAKGEPIDVALLARDIQKDLVTITKITLAPNERPSLTNGKLLFQQNCVTCHGQNGLGDGPGGANLDPKPANFHAEERMSAISAFHSYNTIRLGVPGTGMPAWSQFSDKEVWDLSFYVMALRHFEAIANNKNIPANIISTDNITLEESATLSDVELKAKINDKDENNKNLALALLRTKNGNTSSGEYIGKAKAYLNDSLVAYKNNSKNDAKRLAIQSYLEGIEPIEPMIKANDPALVVKIETEMGKIRKIISDPSGNITQLESQIRLTQNVFSEVEEAIKARELTFGVAFSGSFAIILREGFEAVLIILTLLSVIKAFGNRRAALWVHAGWSSALFLGFVAWFLSGSLMKMSGASREMMEAVTSTVAVFILLYFGFWLHRQTEISRWKKFIHEKVQGALDNKNLWALFSISFLSVFREAFETVLFIRALWFQTDADGKSAISLGLVAALGLIFAFSFLALRYSKKLPIRELFKVSSILTTLLSLILAGKAVHSMQEAGVLNVTNIHWGLRIDTIGLFPTWQTMSAQVVTFIIAMILLNMNATKPNTVTKTA